MAHLCITPTPKTPENHWSFYSIGLSSEMSCGWNRTIFTFSGKVPPCLSWLESSTLFQHWINVLCLDIPSLIYPLPWGRMCLWQIVSPTLWLVFSSLDSVFLKTEIVHLMRSSLSIVFSTEHTFGVVSTSHHKPKVLQVFSCIVWFCFFTFISMIHFELSFVSCV